MNINKNNKTQPDISPQNKSFLVISSYYQVDTLFHMLKNNPNLINMKDQKNETLLSYAIKRKNIENAELILTSKVLDYSYQDQNGNSYLHLAVINQLENIVKTLIKKGINVNLQNNDGNTALHFAYSTGDIKFITIMIESKIDFSIKNKNGLIAEEIAPGTFPEILDINNNNNLNKMNVIHNKNNTVTINLNLDNVNNNSKEIEKDNGTLINERGHINKSIKIDWEGNGTNNKINNNINNIINENQNKLDNTSKTKLKYSLVDYNYSDDDEDEVEEENGIITNKSSSKQQNNYENNKRKDMKSSDIFDLTSSLKYQEKVANASAINAHIVGEPINLINEDNLDLGNNDDIVNINNIKNSLNKPTLTSNNSAIKNLINNEINMSQVSFQTAYENGRNINISQAENGKRMKSDDFRKESIIKENGQSINFDNYASLHKKQEYYDNDNLNKNEFIGFSNYRNSNINQSNEFRPQIEFNQDFAFSPFTTLKEPLNKKSNGSDVNVNNSKITNLLNNNNLNISNNININNEIDSNNNKITENINNNSKFPSLKRTNALNEKSLSNSNINFNINNINNLSLSESNNNNCNKNIKSSSNFNKNNGSIYANLSKVSQNNMNLKTNSKIDFNCPISLSQETLTDSISISRNPLYKFLAEIKMEKYYEIMNLNGFDDIHLLINQTKSGSAIKDKQLKEAGINSPGDRAKILIHLQEKAGNFIFPIPKEVYYICQSENYKNDRNINKLNDWLKALKIENYLEGFIKNGYHSVELMLLQMESKNPLTDEILKDEIGITKIGHRSRIINKLIEEAKSLNNKLKTTMLVVGNAMSEKICDCSIF